MFLVFYNIFMIKITSYRIGQTPSLAGALFRVLADANNRGDLWKAVYDGEYTTIVPEPATCALILGALVLGGTILRRRFKR